MAVAQRSARRLARQEYQRAFPAVDRIADRRGGRRVPAVRQVVPARAGPVWQELRPALLPEVLQQQEAFREECLELRQGHQQAALQEDAHPVAFDLVPVRHPVLVALALLLHRLELGVSAQSHRQPEAVSPDVRWGRSLQAALMA